jgi:hypothetical protein
MSDGQIRTGFAERVTWGEPMVFLRTSRWESVVRGRFYAGSRLARKKVKGEKKLSHVLLRSSFGGSED